MPTYDYECSSGRHKFEAFQRMTARPLRKCPTCGRKVKRLIGAGAGLIFKGSGFYITDYRSADYQARAKADVDKPSSKSGESGSAGTTETKAKAPAKSKGAKSKT